MLLAMQLSAFGPRMTWVRFEELFSLAQTNTRDSGQILIQGEFFTAEYRTSLP